jgi:hypothetical protein
LSLAPDLSAARGLGYVLLTWILILRTEAELRAAKNGPG